tara:strand:- start:474 stop:623 length:150 start_codon:yes stop_codon:yes gene_type:complete
MSSRLPEACFFSGGIFYQIGISDPWFGVKRRCIRFNRSISWLTIEKSSD